MRTRKVVLIIGSLLSVATLVWMWTGSHAGAGNLTLSIVDHGTDQAGLHTVLVQITNQGPYRICYPDGFFVQTRGATMTTHVPTTNLWLDPGEGANVSVSIPSITADWCGVVSYIVENPWNRLKMSVGTSAMGRKLPPFVTAVRGAQVRSSWIRK